MLQSHHMQRSMFLVVLAMPIPIPSPMWRSVKAQCAAKQVRGDLEDDLSKVSTI